MSQEPSGRNVGDGLGAWADEPRDDLTHRLMIVGGQGASGRWHVECALVREPKGGVRWVEGWERPDTDVEQYWEYWEYKGSGNGYSNSLAWLWSAPEGLASAVSYYSELLRESGNPLLWDPPRPIHLDWASGELVELERAPERNYASPTIDDHAVFQTVDLDDLTNSPAPLPRRFAEVASWNLLIQLVRRHPDRLWMRVTHPMEGLPYDCLQVCPLKEPNGFPYLEVNRTGQNGRWGVRADRGFTTGPWTVAWANRHEAEAWMAQTVTMPDASLDQGRLYETPSPSREWIIARERDLGLSPPSAGLPASTPASLALRWIAKFLSMNVDSEHPWYAYSGGDDLTERTADLHPDHRRWQAEHCHPWQRQWVWTLVYGGEDRARLALSAQGDVWTTRRHFRLPELHKSGDRIASLVLRTAGREVG